MAAFLLLLAWIGFRILRSIWLYALLALACYQLGVNSQQNQKTKTSRAVASAAKPAAARGYIDAPGFHFHD